MTPGMPASIAGTEADCQRIARVRESAPAPAGPGRWPARSSLPRPPAARTAPSTACSIASLAWASGRSSAANRSRARLTAIVATSGSQPAASVQAASSPDSAITGAPSAAAVACTSPISPAGWSSSHMSSISCPMKLWLSTPSSPALAWYPMHTVASNSPLRPSSMPIGFGRPRIRAAAGCSRSGSRFRIRPCASLTVTSAAPPASAPRTAALTSSVIITRPRS